jgi:hypothetical protein
MTTRRSTRTRTVRRILLCVCLCSLCPALAACRWLEGEFTSLDPLPPSCRAPAPDAPPPGLEQRP